MKRMLVVLVLINFLLSIQGSCQHGVFLKEGSIEFERKFNQYSILDMNASWGKFYKETLPQFKKTIFSLDFNEKGSLYKATSPPEVQNVFFLSLPSQHNIIYQDLERNNIIAQKEILYDNYWITSRPVIKWKITNETRTICGFECRRANAVILDSIYIVAYYAEQIPISSGPESFSGLPGMILGLAIPSHHTTWFATHVYSRPVMVSEPVNKGQKLTTTYEGLINKMKSAFQDHGAFSSIFYIYALL